MAGLLFQNVAGLLFQNMAVLLLQKKNCLEVISEERVNFFSGEEGEVIPCRVTEDGECAGTDSGKSGTRNLEAESIRDSGDHGTVRKVEDSQRFHLQTWDQVSIQMHVLRQQSIAIKFSFCLCSLFHSFSPPVIFKHKGTRKANGEPDFICDLMT